MIRLSRLVEITPSVIKKLIEQHKVNEVPRLKHLEGYYKGKQSILNRTMRDISKPNNKLVNPFANYITNMMTGYFMGEPVTYSSPQDKIMEEVQSVLTYNDEQDVNTELAKNISIYGVAYEVMYIDRDNKIRFTPMSPTEVICILDNSIEEELLYTIRYYEIFDIVSDDISYGIEVYSDKFIRYYKSDKDLSDIIFLEEVPHYFGLVPFSVYKNNKELIGDFELVTSLIDAYDKIESDAINDQEYSSDAYLVLSGNVDLDEEEVKNMRENRIMLLGEDANAQWLVKGNQGAEVELQKKRLVEDIHKFSECPAMTDENFASNASGVAMRFKLLGMENVCSIKQRQFKRGLQRRLELLANIGNIIGTLDFDWRDISLTFKRSLPVNSVEVANMINQLRGIVSNETLRLQLPFVQDNAVEEELIAKEKEKDLGIFAGGFAIEERITN